MTTTLPADPYTEAHAQEVAVETGAPVEAIVRDQKGGTLDDAKRIQLK